MGWNGVGKLVEVQGKMTAEQYCKILEHGMEKRFEKLRSLLSPTYSAQSPIGLHSDLGLS